MNVLLLPGNSPRHAMWVEELKAAIAPFADTVVTHTYRHWQTGETQADVAHESISVAAQAAHLQPYTLIAKSIGTVVALKGTSERMLAPEKSILLGIPINGTADREIVRQWLAHTITPVVIVQNTADPLGSFAEVKAAFEGSSSLVSFVELPGTTHDYTDFAAITALL